MKHIFIVIFCFSAVAATAQVVESDTLYLYYSADIDQFVEVRDTRFEDGRRNLTEKPVGDTTEVEVKVLEVARRQAEQFTIYVNHVWGKPELINFILSMDNTLFNLTGSRLTQLSAEAHGQSLIGSWQISTDSGATFFNCTISRPTPQTLRLTAGGQNYVLLAIGTHWLRIINLPGVGTVDMHKAEGKAQFKDVTQTVILKK